MQGASGYGRSGRVEVSNVHVVWPNGGSGTRLLLFCCCCDGGGTWHEEEKRKRRARIRRTDDLNQIISNPTYSGIPFDLAGRNSKEMDPLDLAGRNSK